MVAADKLARVVRVVAVSPGDVRAERDRLQVVVDELNRGLARECGCWLSLWRWEIDAHSGLHLEGPQGLIDDAMRIEHADVVVGIFWKRLGSPTSDAASGTEHELWRAWSAWQERGSPQVLVYFCERNHMPKDAAEADQLRRVLSFREAMPKEQLWWPYTTAADFERVVRQHLTTFVLTLQSPTAEAARSIPAPSAQRRRRVRFRLPLAAAHFTGRHAELDAIEQALGVADRAVITQAIAGLGGVGKSQLAARYVHEHLDDYDVVAWIRAEDGGIADLALLASELCELPPDKTIDDRAATALRWLAGCEERWLLVLDNVTAPEQLAACCPRAGNGRVVITTRDRAVGQFAPLLTVDVFDEDTAIDYLLARSGHAEARASARRVIRALGCLPLALAHAGAYCAQGTALDDYLQLLEQLPTSEVFDRSPEAFYRETVASTWQVSMRAAAAHAELATKVLAMAALLAPDDIPRTLFEALIDPYDLQHRKALIDAAAALHRFSLAVVTPGSLSVHRLLQRVVVDSDTPDLDHAAIAAISALEAALPDGPRLPDRWPVYERLVPHILALGEAQKNPTADAERLIGLLNNVSEYLLHAAGPQRAIDAVTSTNRHALRLLGPKHLKTLTARHHLARACRMAGRVSDAIELFRQLIADRERLLGPAHPNTLAARHNLVGCYYDADRTDEAIALAEQVLADTQRVLGAGHPDTLSSYNNLADAYQRAGCSSKAVMLQQQALVQFERLRGDEHLDTISARFKLALAYHDAGRPSDAIPLFEKVLEARERLLGHEHPDTLLTRNSLAGSYHAAGHTGEAINLQEQVLVQLEHVFGAEHPDTITARDNLARVYHSAGRTSDAITHEERVLADRERILGPEHPSTLGARDSLARVYCSAGRPSDAITLFEQVVAERERLLGTEHSATIAARHDLAHSYWSAGRPSDAIPLFEKVLEERERLLGHEHSDTLVTRGNLGGSYLAARRTSKAIKLLQRVLTDSERLLGAEHPNTLNTRDLLAVAYHRAGRIGEAIALLERVLADSERLLGIEHPDTLATRDLLAGWYRSVGRTRDAHRVLGEQ